MFTVQVLRISCWDSLNVQAGTQQVVTLNGPSTFWVHEKTGSNWNAFLNKIFQVYFKNYMEIQSMANGVL